LLCSINCSSSKSFICLNSKFSYTAPPSSVSSATPSLESYARALKKVYTLVEMPQRIYGDMPDTKLIDMKSAMRNGESHLLSKTLKDAIVDRLNKNEQCILLLNRRGFSNAVSCRKCGHVFKCPTCGVALTYHKNENILKCHHCDYVLAYPSNCPECNSSYFMNVGFGCERVEKEVNTLFPNAKTLRLDSDTAKVRTSVAKTLKKFENKEAQILIGTQMIAKGHDFKDCTLVGIVLADIGLNVPHYRSSDLPHQQPIWSLHGFRH
jgi:primosomal protein N' (replication factor Y)